MFKSKLDICSLGSFKRNSKSAKSLDSPKIEATALRSRLSLISELVALTVVLSCAKELANNKHIKDESNSLVFIACNFKIHNSVTTANPISVPRINFHKSLTKITVF